MNLEEEDGREWVADGAREHGLADEKLIDLYSRISLVVYENEDKYGYECIGSGIGNNTMDFSIRMPKGHPLPEDLSLIFFNKIDTRFKVTCSKVEPKHSNYSEKEDQYSFKVRYKPNEEFEIKKQK